MKVLLLRPKPHKDTIGLQHVMICEPLELEYIGGYLKDQHEVVIYDMIIEKLDLQTILEKEKPQLVGMTGYISHVGIIKDYAREIKAWSQEVITVVGGIHAEVLPEDYESPFIDHILAANGLKNIKRIADGEVLEKIIRETKERCFDYPHPDRSLISRYKKHYYYMFHNPCSLIKTSFGCPYSCAFCFCKEITDGHYFTRTLEDIIEEIKTIQDEEVYIVDDDFLFNATRLREWARRLKEEGIQKKYLVYGRADFIASNEELMAELKEVGLRAVIVGLESYSDEELDQYNKKSSTPTSKKALEILKKYDIECYGTFILGLDWDKQDFKNLYNFIKEIGIQFINLQPITPMPKTVLYDQYKEQLIVERDAYHKWDMAHLVVAPSKLSIRQYYWEVVKLYYRITVRPEMVVRALRKYPLWENIKLTIGANRVMWQYIVRIIKGEP
ncbi:MAG: B12-binding domain-containing radical SAM protein [Cellulosilyticaceae bacterium]